VQSGTAIALAALPSIPRDEAGPDFPAPWTATAFAMTVALHQKGLFTWSEWADRLSRAIAGDAEADATDPQAYWCSWLAALEETIAAAGLAASGDLERLQNAWRVAAEATPHGEPIALSEQIKASVNR
jgi:nitrile hydratase accessory protein